MVLLSIVVQDNHEDIVQTLTPAALTPKYFIYECIMSTEC